MTGETLSRGLAKSNATMHSTSGQKEGKGNINIFDEVNWDKTKLTLDAQNDINIFSNMNGSGTAKLELKYGQQSSDGGDAEVIFKRNAKVNLPEGKNLAIQKGRSGKKYEMMVIHDMPQGDTFSANDIALGKDMDISYTANRSGFKGWSFPANNHSGSLWGLGHEVKGLTIKGDDSDYFLGLVPEIRNGAIRDLKVIDFNISGKSNSLIGGAVGFIDSSKIVNINTTGKIRGGTSGGVAGFMKNSTMHNSSASVDIEADSRNGGLVGEMQNSIVNSSFSSGLIHEVKNNSTSHLGGIVGFSNINNKITNSSSSVNISTGKYGSIGGLVGINIGDIDIEYSHAIGNLIINNYDKISGGGGLIGHTAGYNNKDLDRINKRVRINKSYATGNINNSGTSATGGLIGYAEKESQINVEDSYFTGNLSGSANVGGLLGKVVNANISDSYVTGHISGTPTFHGDVKTGGLVGSADGIIHIKNSYFNNQTTGQTAAVGNKPASNFKDTSVTTAEMKQKDLYGSWDPKVWDIKDGAYPKLRPYVPNNSNPNPPGSNNGGNTNPPNNGSNTNPPNNNSGNNNQQPSKPNPSQNVQTPPAKNDTAANKQPPKKPDVEQSAKPKPDIKPQVNKLDDKTATEMNAEIFGLHNSANIAKKEESETRKQIVLDKYKENQEIKQKEREVRAMISPKLRSELDKRGELDNFVRGIAVFSYQNKKSALEIIDIISSLYEINEEAENRAEDLAENITADVKLQGGWGTITVKEYFKSIFEARMKHNLIDRLLDFYPRLREQANRVATQYGENRERYNKFNMNRINKEMSEKKISTINKEGFFEQTDSTIQWVGRTFLDATANNAFSFIDAFKTTYHGAKTYVMYEISSAKSALNDAKKSIAKAINITEKEKHLEMLKNEAYLLDFNKNIQELLMENIPEASSNITDLVARDPEASVKLTHSVRKILNNINAVAELVDGNKYVDFTNSIGDLTEKGDNIIKSIETLKSIDNFSNELLSNGEKDQFKNIYIRNIIHDGVDALDAVNKAIFAFVEKEKAKQISEAFSNAKDTLSSLSKMVENVGDRDLAMKMRNIDRFVKNEKPYLSNIVHFQRKELQEMFIAIGESEKSKGTSR